MRRTYALCLPVAASLLMATPVCRAQSLNDDFNSLTMADRVSTSGALSCSGTVNTNTSSMSLSVPTGSGNWAMLVSGSYPLTWMGTNATSTWAISGGNMYTHARTNSIYDDGLAWISRVTFDRNKYLSAIGAFSLDTCVSSDAACMAGVTLIQSESNYREIGVRSIGMVNGQLMLEARRLSPCNEIPLRDASGAPIQFLANQLKTFRVDYLGPEGGGWRYYVDGTLAFISSGAGYVSTESTSIFPDTELIGNPHVGLYWTAQLINGADQYVEGHVDRATVYELSKVTGVSATASSFYPGYPASQAVDGNSGSFWSAGGGAPQWIELDLGATRTIRKLRLLTQQTPAGATSHNIYLGAAPGPASLIGTISQYTSNNQWIEFDFLEAGVSGRYLRVSTTSSPSWVAWSEIEVFE